MRKETLCWSHDKSPLGQIVQAAYQYGSPGVTPKRLLGAFALVYLFNGSGYYADINHKQYSVRAGDMLLLFPDVAHWYGPKGSDWDEFFIEFHGPVFDMWLSSGVLDISRPIYRLGVSDNWLKRMVGILDVDIPDQSLKQLIMVGRLQSFLAEVVATEPVHLDLSSDLWLVTAYHWLGASLSIHMDYHWLANLVGMPYDRFRKRFTQEAGMSPRQYRDGKRIEMAKKLLIESKLSLKEIAAAIGFYDEFIFSNRFKQVVGTAPRNFRRAMNDERKEPAIQIPEEPEPNFY